MARPPAVGVQRFGKGVGARGCGGQCPAPFSSKTFGKNVEFRCCERSLSILREAGFEAVPASEEDWDTEYLDYILGIRVVKDIEEALAHIARIPAATANVLLQRITITLPFSQKEWILLRYM